MADTEASRSSGGGSAARLTERNSRRTAKEAERRSVFIGDLAGQGGFRMFRTRPSRLIAGGPRQSTRFQDSPDIAGGCHQPLFSIPTTQNAGEPIPGAYFKLIITERAQNGRGKCGMVVALVGMTHWRSPGIVGSLLEPFVHRPGPID